MNNRKDIHSGKNRLKVLLMTAVLAAFVSSCVENNKIDNTYKRTVLVYIAADNNLSNVAQNNIYSMTSSIRNENDNANLVAFVDRVDNAPALLYIHNGVRDTLVKYEELDTTDPQVLHDVIDYVVEKFPSESYGLVLWSHGTGWLPTSQLHFVAPNMNYAQLRDGQTAYLSAADGVRDPFSADMVADTKAFAWENRQGETPKYSCMDLDDLVGAIPDDVFDFIAFDACYMGCVEVIYALRHKADYIISSCYEVVNSGFPYHIITRDLLNGSLMKICREFHTYYNSLSGWERMAGISLVKTDELDSLARCFGKIVAEYGEDIPKLDENGVQCFDRFSNHVFYDLEDLADKLNIKKEYLMELRLQLERVVPYKVSTAYIFPGDREQIKVDKYCGMSVYIPFEQYETGGLNADFRATEWSIATGYGQ